VSFDGCIDGSGNKFTGTTFDVMFNYDDPDGDASKSKGAKVWAGFNNSNPNFDATNFSSITGDGFTGSVTSDLCYPFGGSSSVRIYMRLEDGADRLSNTLNIRINKPSGAP
jgi:hypothetical protein